MILKLKEQFELHLLQLSFNNNKLYEPVKYINSIGGKRARPILCFLAANMFNNNIENTFNAATAIEFFHNFSLMHDDIMDKADLRRGKQTVHKKFNNNSAILSGDVMLVNAFQFLQKYNDNIAKKLTEIFGKTAVNVCEGQQLDMDFEERNNVSESEYINMIKNKTAVLIGASLQIGATTANANQKEAETLYKFGENIGICFQLLDDLLDCFGNEKFGKKIGGDILQNKKTYLLIKTLELANQSQKDQIIKWFEKKDYEEKNKINFFLDIYKELEIDKLTKHKAKQYHDKAFNYLNELKVEETKKQPLIKYANDLLNRSF